MAGTLRWAVAAIALCASPALAQGAGEVGPATIGAASAAPAAPAADADGLKRLTPADLGALNGMGDPGATPVSVQVLTSTVTGNTINSAGSISSGDIDLSGAALSGFNGIGNFAMNTGHNNSLQSSVTVNIILAPASH